MSALAHFLERDGLPTALIGLIRQHVERMRPPRALAVPFELGRPLGAPDDPAFQRRVLGALIELFKAPAGPVLVDFPEQAPGAPADMEGWACPISLPAPPATGSAFDQLRSALDDEIARLRPWYDEIVRTRGRTTVGISGVEIGRIPALLMQFAQDLSMPSPQSGVPMAQVIKRASDDLRAFHYEAATAKPGRVSDVQLGNWFWGETAAGRALLALRKACLTSDDAAIKVLGERQLVPNHQRDKIV